MSKRYFRPARFLGFLICSLTVVTVFLTCQRDRTLPEVSVLTPADNGVAMGYVTIQAKAFDNKSVPVVEFYVDDVFQGVDSVGGEDSVYTGVWDATAEAMGSEHKVKAKATDAAGNTAEAEITMTIGIPPGPTYHHGRIVYPETWSPIGNPHIVDGNLTANGIVTIEPGVQVKVNAAVAIRFASGGGMMARGTAASPILITSAATTPVPGDWQGIEIASGARGDSVILEYCTIEYGGEDTTGANLVCRSTPITVNHCTIRNGIGYGVWTVANNVKEFTHNVITGNRRFAMRLDSRYVRVVDPSNSITGNGGGIEVTGGTVAENATWYNPGAPYVITSDLLIGSTSPAVLTLESGVNLRFRAGMGVIVGLDPAHRGGLVAAGTSADPVVFTSDTGNTTRSRGYWKGITFSRYTATDQAVLGNCTIEYAGGNEFASVYCDSVPAAITNSTIRRSGTYGVMIRRTGFKVFTGNTIGLCQNYPVLVEPDFVPTVGNNTLDRGLLVADGIVTKSATWNYQGFPWVISGMLQVGDPNCPVLTLTAGDTIIFGDSAVLRVGSLATDSGALRASGVVFTNLSWNHGAWKGLEFLDYTMSASSNLLNCVVEYGGANLRGNILCQPATPQIVGNEIAHSSTWGIYLYNSPLNADTLRANNTFDDNVRGKVGPNGP